MELTSEQKNTKNNCEHGKRKSRCKDCLLPDDYISYRYKLSCKRVFSIFGKFKRTKKWTEYLGCDFKYFTEFIKNKMVQGMTVYNIHLDHIKPVTNFNLTNYDDLCACVHYTNFQPLLPSENIKKKNKWGYQDEIFWNENIKGKDFNTKYIPRGGPQCPLCIQNNYLYIQCETCKLRFCEEGSRRRGPDANLLASLKTEFRQLEKCATREHRLQIAHSSSPNDAVVRSVRSSNSIGGVLVANKIDLREVARELNAANKVSAKRRRKSGNCSPSDFVKPTLISPELASFLGKTAGTEMARIEVTREINAYIRKNKLLDKSNGRKINPDSDLSKLLKLNAGDELTYFNLQRFMSPHFAKTKPDVAPTVNGGRAGGGSESSEGDSSERDEAEEEGEAGGDSSLEL